ncbi:MAG: exosortase-associated EpsI family protein [Roseibacillus sp.]
MNLFWRSGIFGGLALVTVLSCLFFSDSKTNPVAGVVVWLPDELSDYEVDTGVMGEEEKKWLPSDTTFLKRVYTERWLPKQEADFRALSATLIVAGSDSRSLHRPQVCLTAQHWTIEKREVVKLDTKGGPLEVMDFHLVRTVRNQDGSARLDESGEPLFIRAHYVYWWIGPDASTASDEERVWLEVWNSILKGRKERWAYPSVMVWVDPREKQGEARERAFEFIKEYAPDFQKSLGAQDREGAVDLKSIGSE